MQDVVIKYLTVRLDEDLKRQKKYVHKREVARRAPSAPHAGPAIRSPAASTCGTGASPGELVGDNVAAAGRFA